MANDPQEKPQELPKYEFVDPQTKFVGHVTSASPRQMLPYRWGKFRGWVSLVVGMFAASFAILSLSTGATMDDRSTGYAMASPLLIASGYAFVRRRKYAVVMVYVWMVFYVLIFLAYLIDALTTKALTPELQGEEIGRGLGIMVIGLVFWLLCARYYRRRLPECS